MSDTRLMNKKKCDKLRVGPEVKSQCMVSELYPKS